MMHKRLAALGGAAAAATALTATALAGGSAAAQLPPAVAPGASCVGSFAHTLGAIPLLASRFPANAPVTFEANGVPIKTATASAAGTVNTFALPPSFNGKRKTFQLTAVSGSVSAGPVPMRVTKIGVTTKPAHTKPTNKVRFSAFGFFPGKRVYLFIRRHGRTLGRFSLGKARGACGDVTKRMRFMPLRHFSAGAYQYWFSYKGRFDKRFSIGYRATITVRVVHH
jgi:hypothetical protein